MFHRLDRYIVRTFAEPFLVATASIVGLYLVGEMFSKLEDYLRQAHGVREALFRMAQMYALRIPTLIAPVLPIAMLFGASYGVGQLSSRNEITAMRASGLSFWRVLAPVYAAAVFIAMVGFGNNEWLVPRIEQIAAPKLQEWTGERKVEARVTVYVEQEDRLFHMTYYPAERRARGFVVVTPTPSGAVQTVAAEEAVPCPGGWTLIHKPDPRDPAAQPREEVFKTRLRSRDIELQLVAPDVQPIRILLRRLRLAENPDERRRLLLPLYSRLAYPFVGLVLVAIGVPFVIGHERVRRNRMLGTGVCIIICMVFYTVQLMSMKLGEVGRLSPALASFLPLIIFGGIGLYLLENVHS